jgi:hypothetical protein
MTASRSCTCCTTASCRRSTCERSESGRRVASTECLTVRAASRRPRPDARRCLRRVLGIVVRDVERERVGDDHDTAAVGCIELERPHRVEHARVQRWVFECRLLRLDLDVLHTAVCGDDEARDDTTGRRRLTTAEYRFVAGPNGVDVRGDHAADVVRGEAAASRHLRRCIGRGWSGLRGCLCNGRSGRGVRSGHARAREGSQERESGRTHAQTVRDTPHAGKDVVCVRAVGDE